MIVIETVRQLHEHGYSVSTSCGKCNRMFGGLDLALIIAQGNEDKRPIDLGLECPMCRGLVGLTIQPPSGPGGRPDFMLQKAQQS
jgi:hypothetical protein